jgi:probable rRNA maturation factor
MIPIDILTESRVEARFGPALRRGLAAFVQQAAQAAQLKGGISILLTDDREIRRLNREFRHKDKATDVLSFPASSANGHALMSGDLAISIESATRQAKEQGHALATELRILILHGLLHLAGFDHETDCGQMARKEAALRLRLNLQPGLIERSEAGSNPPTHPPRSPRTPPPRRPIPTASAKPKRGSRR